MPGFLLAMLVVLGVDVASLEAKLDETIPPRLEETHVPGLVVSVVADGEVKLARGYGLASVEDERPMTADTPVRVASLSKTFTATAVALLEERGQLDLDADMRTYLGEAALEHPITLRHLLSHTSGVINNNVGRVALERPQESLGDFLARTMPPRVFAPGRGVLYSNHGNALAGRVVELQSGRAFADFVEAEILAPLQMNASGYDVPDDLATSYVIDAQGRTRQIYLHFRTVPASGMITTAHDMGRYMLLHAGDGQPILAPATMAKMRKKVGVIHDALPAYHYAFAHARFAGHPSRAHGGSVPAFLSRFVIFDDRGVGVFVAQNAFGENLTGEIAKLVVQEMLGPGEELDLPPAAAPDAATLAGSYRMLSKRLTPAFTQPVATLMDAEVDVAVDDHGQLHVNGKRFHWVREHEFRAPKKSGGYETLVFIAHEGGELWMHRGFSSGYRRPVVSARALHVTLVAVCLVVLLGVAVSTKWTGRRAAAVAAVALVGFVVPHLYVLYVDAGQPLYLQPMRFGAPWWLAAVRGLRYVAVGLSVLALVRPGTHKRRGGLATAAVATAALIAVELFWDLGDPGLG